MNTCEHSTPLCAAKGCPNFGLPEPHEFFATAIRAREAKRPVPLTRLPYADRTVLLLENIRHLIARYPAIGDRAQAHRWMALSLLHGDDPFRDIPEFRAAESFLGWDK